MLFKETVSFDQLTALELGTWGARRRQREKK